MEKTEKTHQELQKRTFGGGKLENQNWKGLQMKRFMGLKPDIRITQFRWHGHVRRNI